MLDMRVRIDDLMKRPGAPKTAGQLARLVEQHGVTQRTAYRLVAAKGNVRYLDMRLAEALCDVFGIGPGELLERDKRKR